MFFNHVYNCAALLTDLEIREDDAGTDFSSQIFFCIIVSSFEPVAAVDVQWRFTNRLVLLRRRCDLVILIFKPLWPVSQANSSRCGAFSVCSVYAFKDVKFA